MNKDKLYSKPHWKKMRESGSVSAQYSPKFYCYVIAYIEPNGTINKIDTYSEEYPTQNMRLAPIHLHKVVDSSFHNAHRKALNWCQQHDWIWQWVSPNTEKIAFYKALRDNPIQAPADVWSKALVWFEKQKKQREEYEKII